MQPVLKSRELMALFLLMQLGVLEDAVLFQSTIPEAADISMAIVYAIFGKCAV